MLPRLRKSTSLHGLDNGTSIQRLRQINEKEALAQTGQLHNQLAAELGKFQSDLESTRKQVNNLTSIRQYVKTLDEKSVEAEQKGVTQQSLATSSQYCRGQTQKLCGKHPVRYRPAGR